jgi:hypothetical protein
MIKNKHTRKTIAVFFLLFSFLYEVKAQGPNAVEAAAFEPVDATDMVNLVTGNLSYVLPILNVPSPEGGYPVALSYHSGIAMEQESSWTGLGWNVNVGSINRGVNGFPDDWGKTNVHEFFYDEGWDKDYYSFSAGVSLGNSLSVGLGLSWGSNQSLGGYVELGIGVGTSGSLGLRIGTDGAGINAGYKGAGVSLSTSGVGLSYGFKNKGSNSSLGVSMNYNYSSGLSGGISIKESHGTFGNKKNGVANTSSIGISFGSKGVSVNAKVRGVGMGVSTSMSSISSGDYDVDVSTSGFYIPAFIFYIGYSHTNIKYSLFRFREQHVSGIIYPKHNVSKSTYYYNGYQRTVQKNSHFMDVNLISKFDSSNLYDDLLDRENDNNKNNLILPNYDNYSVNAQGISGVISPYIFKDIKLSSRNLSNTGGNSPYIYYDNDYKFRDFKINFTFTNSYNSFSRTDKKNLLTNISGVDFVGGRNVLDKFTFNKSDNYSNNNSYSNNKKREGNSIETYTNLEIRQGNIPGFIDAISEDSFLNRNDKNIFQDEGIGGFKVTAIDGKIYNYSLPVYQLEQFYRNFKNLDKKDKAFNEIIKTSSYATHWLLTSITGPDYFDKNRNGKVDNGDYGYWVEFDYGKWADGYMWKTPNGRYEKIKEKKNRNSYPSRISRESNTNDNITYSYSEGCKELYYLDAIKTRTHTALFVKDIRKDSKSHSYHLYTKKWNVSNEFKDENSSFYVGKQAVHSEAGKVYYQASGNVRNSGFSTNKAVFKYVDMTEETSKLSLNKIILLKNEKLPNYNIKNRGKQSGKFTGYYKLNHGGHALYGPEIYFEYPVPYPLVNNKYENVIDVKDIENSGVESNASQIIEFDYDYSLAGNTPTNNKYEGRLTLNKVNFKGKGGVQLLPPYEFEYEKRNIDYNKDHIDSWGYNKDDNAIWSLNKIHTPTGGQIKINYENDSFLHEAYYSKEISYRYKSRRTNNRIKVIENIDVSRGIIKFKENINPKHFLIGDKYKILYLESSRSDRCVVRGANCSRAGYSEFCNHKEEVFKVISKGDDWIQLANFNKIFSGIILCEIVLFTYESAAPVNTNGGGIRTKSITISDGIKDIATTEYEYNGGITSYAPGNYQKGVPYLSELPSPMVMYRNVEMKTKDGRGVNLGKMVYNFETLRPRRFEEGYLFSLGESFRVKNNQDISFENGKIIANKYTIESRLGNLGRIQSIFSYNQFGQLLSQSKNNYKHNLDKDKEIGVVQETHSSYKWEQRNNVEKFYVSSTSKIDYPSVLESVEETAGGLTKTKYFDKYDFLTGQVLETRTYASDGKAFKTKTVPAYTEYSKMGSKVDDITNKNMLTQETANYTYIFKDNDWKEIGVGITTWNNIWDYQFNNRSTGATSEIWRKHKSYIWKGAKNNDGVFDSSNQFNWAIGATQNNNWQKTSETTRYNQFSNPLEVKDINNNYASSKMGDNYSKVIATANANYDEMHYSGAEYLASENSAYFDGGIKSLGYKRVVDAHTGTHVVEVNTGQSAFEINIPTRDDRTGIKQRFKVSVWVRKGQETKAKIKVKKVNGSSSSISFNTNENVQAGNWVLLSGYVTIPVEGVTISITSSGGLIQLDDFRLHPATSSMTSYVYNKWDEVSYITGSNGLSTHYIYDAAGRLKETQVEVVTNLPAGINGGFEKVSTNSYNYKRNQ